MFIFPFSPYTIMRAYMCAYAHVFVYAYVYMCVSVCLRVTVGICVGQRPTSGLFFNYIPPYL